VTSSADACASLVAAANHQRQRVARVHCLLLFEHISNLTAAATASSKAPLSTLGSHPSRWRLNVSVFELISCLGHSSMCVGGEMQLSSFKQAESACVANTANNPPNNSQQQSTTHLLHQDEVRV
jgi:hypothetical protein